MQYNIKMSKEEHDEYMNLKNRFEDKLNERMEEFERINNVMSNRLGGMAIGIIVTLSFIWLLSWM